MSSSSSSSLTLPSLLHRTLTSLLPIFTDTLSLSSPLAQSTLSSSLPDLDLILRMIGSLGVFSENEEMEDVGDGEMVYMAVEWVKGEVEGRVNGEGGMMGRMRTLEASKSSLESFLFLLESHSFPLPPSFSFPTTLPTNTDNDSGPSRSGAGDGANTSSTAGRAGMGMGGNGQAGRREMKIKQYRAEKEWRDKVAAGLPDTSLTSSPLPAILALLELSQSTSEDNPSSTSSSNPTKPKLNIASNPLSSSSSATDHLRSTTLSLLTLLLIQSIQSLTSIEQEIDLLRSASSSARIIDEEQEALERSRAASRTKQEGPQKSYSHLKPDESWRLDLPLNSLSSRNNPNSKSHLIDPQGKPTQPFTILPSAGLQGLSDRARFEAGVFRSGHRLPSMTIEEYLEEERRRGNIITGGG